MSRSYRKPYATWVSGRRSANWDKTFARRSVRRQENQVLREAIRHDDDWDEVLIPDKYECRHNDVWCWGRDGKQKLITRSDQYNNPWAHVWYHSRLHTLEDVIKEWRERQKRNDEWIAYLSRK